MRLSLAAVLFVSTVAVSNIFYFRLDDVQTSLPAYLQGVSAPYSSPIDNAQATVMAIAFGYNLPVFHRFVGSLRKSGYAGNIILGISSDASPDLLEYLNARHVLVKNVTWTNCTFPIPATVDRSKLRAEITQCAAPYTEAKVRYSRFALATDWLEECTECTGPVLWLDVADVYFQRIRLDQALLP